ncbi:MAG: S8 family serine peptidase [Micromonosporaceae bacterium]|nr:S8 family serine peptidase [Micromonosporaceae bacterium]
MMRLPSRRTLLIPSAVTALALLLPGNASASQNTDAPPESAAASDYAIVLLRDPPAASYRGTIPGLQRTAPERGLLDRTSPAYRAYLRHLANAQDKVRGYLRQRAPQVEVTRAYQDILNGVAVKLNGADPARLANAPGVRAVAPSALYRPAMNRSVDLIRAAEVWGQLGGGPEAGEGVRVAVIDSGIDVSSPFFDDTGLPAQPQQDECDDQDADPTTPDTNNKVVVCKVFVSGDAAGPGPELVIDHGSHVAGTIGGRFGTSGTVAGTDVTLTDLSGVAPGATLGNYNVFPGIGAGFVAFGGSAFSHDIAAALEEAVADGMQVANLSLGGAVQGPHDALAEASNAAVDAGMAVVIAAGNSGPGDATVESPGSADRVITAGASTNPHFIGVPVAVAGSDSIGGAVGDFDPFSTPVTADYTVTEPANGCTPISTDLTGQIALIDRGVCAFTVKIRNAEAAGAAGVIVANSVAGDPTAMAHDGTALPGIPAVMVGLAEGTAMKPSGTVTVDGTDAAEFVSENADIIAGFSSRGPTPFTTQIKPDLTGPGVNVASSVFGGEFAFFQGTSMATPHLSGVAALLLDRFPGATPAELKSRMANNAARVVTDDLTGTTDPGVLTRGGGRVDVVAAFDATSWFDPVSVSLGEVRASRPFSQTHTIAVNGTPAASAEVMFSEPAPAGFSLTATVDGELVTLDAAIDRTVGNGDYEGDVQITGTDGQTYLVPFFVRVTGRR